MRSEAPSPMRQVPGERDMSLTNTRRAYGWIAIALHWISAVGVVAMYFLGERMEDAPDRAAKVAAQGLHVSVGVLLLTFLLARCLSTAASLGGWEGGVQNSGQGIACHSFRGSRIAVLAEAHIGEGQAISVDRIVAAVDCGRQ
eukprot:gene238-341_t